MKTLSLLPLLFAFLAPGGVAAAESRFSDVTDQTQYHTAIEYLAERGIVGGYADGRFGPENTLTRAELLKILLEAKAGFVKADVTTGKCFPDVETTAWYAPYVCYAKRTGMVAGFPDGRFLPNKSVSKAEAAKMLVESRGYIPANEVKLGGYFSDADDSEWYAPYVQYMVNENLLPERNEPVFQPAEETPRGLIAEYLYRALTREVKKKALGIGTPLTIEAEEYEKIKNIVHPIREYYYGNYWLELTDEDLAKMPEGVKYKVEEYAFLIGGVDPLLDTLDVPAELQAAEGEGDEKGLYILQYVARNMTDWNQKIKDLGLDKIGYTGGTNYLVWASPNELQQAKQFDFVRVVVPYHGQFKISPNLQDKIGQNIKIRVEYYNDGTNYEQTKSQLIELGANAEEFGDHPTVSAGTRYIVVPFTLTEETLIGLARLPQVISLSWQPPVAER